MNSIVINNNKKYSITEFYFETFYDKDAGIGRSIRVTFGEPTAENTEWDEYYNIPITSIVIKDEDKVLYELNNINGYFESSAIQIDMNKMISRAIIHIGPTLQGV